MPPITTQTTRGQTPDTSFTESRIGGGQAGTREQQRALQGREVSGAVSPSRNAGFLEYMRTWGTEHHSSLTIENFTGLVRTWNENHPAQKVTPNPYEFLKLALRNPYGLQARDGQPGEPTISPTYLSYLATGRMPAGLTAEQQSLMKGTGTHQYLQLQSVWGKDKFGLGAMPFTFEAFRKAIDFEDSVVELSRSGSNNFVSVMNARRIVTSRTGLSDFQSTKTQVAIERRNTGEDYIPVGQQEYAERQLRFAQQAQSNQDAISQWRQGHGGQMPSLQEQAHIVLASASADRLKQIVGAPAQLYQMLTGLKREDAPYAIAALDFLGGVVSSPFVATRQGLIAAQDPTRYIRDVWLNAPETVNSLFKSVNVFDPSLSGPERFTRALNAVAAVGAIKASPRVQQFLESGSREGRAAFAEALAEVKSPTINKMGGKRGFTPAEGVRFVRDLAQSLREKASHLRGASRTELEGVADTLSNRNVGRIPIPRSVSRIGSNHILSAQAIAARGIRPGYSVQTAQALGAYIQEGLRLIKSEQYDLAMKHFTSEEAGRKFGFNIRPLEVKDFDEAMLGQPGGVERVANGANGGYFIRDTQTITPPTALSMRVNGRRTPMSQYDGPYKAQLKEVRLTLACNYAEEWIHGLQSVLNDAPVSSIGQYVQPHYPWSKLHEYDIAFTLEQEGIKVPNAFLAPVRHERLPAMKAVGLR